MIEPEELELLAGYHHGTDLAERLRGTLDAQAKQAEGLRRAAEEIRRLRAILAASPPPFGTHVLVDGQWCPLDGDDE